MRFRFLLGQPPVDPSFFSVVDGEALFNAVGEKGEELKWTTVEQIGWHSVDLPEGWFSTTQNRTTVSCLVETLQCTIQYIQCLLRKSEKRLQHTIHALEQCAAERDTAFEELVELREMLAVCKMRLHATRGTKHKNGSDFVNGQVGGGLEGKTRLSGKAPSGAPSGALVCSQCHNTYPSTHALKSHMIKRHKRSEAYSSVGSAFAATAQAVCRRRDSAAGGANADVREKQETRMMQSLYEELSNLCTTITKLVEKHAEPLHSPHPASTQAIPAAGALPFYGDSHPAMQSNTLSRVERGQAKYDNHHNTQELQAMQQTIVSLDGRLTELECLLRLRQATGGGVLPTKGIESFAETNSKLQTTGLAREINSHGFREPQGDSRSGQVQASKSSGLPYLSNTSGLSRRDAQVVSPQAGVVPISFSTTPQTPPTKHSDSVPNANLLLRKTNMWKEHLTGKAKQQKGDVTSALPTPETRTVAASESSLATLPNALSRYSPAESKSVQQSTAQAALTPSNFSSMLSPPSHAAGITHAKPSLGSSVVLDATVAEEAILVSPPQSDTADASRSSLNIKGNDLAQLGVSNSSARFSAASLFLRACSAHDKQKETHQQGSALSSLSVDPFHTQYPAEEDGELHCSSVNLDRSLPFTVRNAFPPKALRFASRDDLSTPAPLRDVLSGGFTMELSLSTQNNRRILRGSGEEALQQTTLTRTSSSSLSSSSASVPVSSAYPSAPLQDKILASPDLTSVAANDVSHETLGDPPIHHATNQERERMQEVWINASESNGNETEKRGTHGGNGESRSREGLRSEHNHDIVKRGAHHEKSAPLRLLHHDVSALSISLPLPAQTSDTRASPGALGYPGAHSRSGEERQLSSRLNKIGDGSDSSESPYEEHSTYSYSKSDEEDAEVVSKGGRRTPSSPAHLERRVFQHEQAREVPRSASHQSKQVVVSEEAKGSALLPPQHPHVMPTTNVDNHERLRHANKFQAGSTEDKTSVPVAKAGSSSPHDNGSLIKDKSKQKTKKKGFFSRLIGKRKKH